MSKIFKMPENVIIPKARVEKTGEEVMSVAFDLGVGNRRTTNSNGS